MEKRIPIISNVREIGYYEVEEARKTGISIEPKIKPFSFKNLRVTENKNIISDKKPDYGNCEQGSCGNILDKNTAISCRPSFLGGELKLYFCCKRCEDRWWGNMHG